MMDARKLFLDQITYQGVNRYTSNKGISKKSMLGHKVGRIVKFNKDEIDHFWDRADKALETSKLK
jgi:hypothetical protein